MRVTVIAVGTRMPSWVEQGVREYDRRLPRELRLCWKEIATARRGGASAESLRVHEGERQLGALPAGDRVVALDVGGRRLSTQALADELEAWLMSGDNYSILIGGPDGLSPACLARADQCWSLSDLTLPHGLVRVVLAEQLYRAWTIAAGHPYHRRKQ